MTLTTIKVYSSYETAHTLRLTLGPLFNWEDRLADMRRNKVTYGPILLPVARAAGARAYRPVYRGTNIAQFIVEYRSYDLNASSGIKPAFELLEIDDMDKRHWRVRKLQAATIKRSASSSSVTLPSAALSKTPSKAATVPSL